MIAMREGTYDMLVGRHYHAAILHRFMVSRRGKCKRVVDGQAQSCSNSITVFCTPQTRCVIRACDQQHCVRSEVPSELVQVRGRHMIVTTFRSVREVMDSWISLSYRAHLGSFFMAVGITALVTQTRPH